MRRHGARPDRAGHGTAARPLAAVLGVALMITGCAAKESASAGPGTRSLIPGLHSCGVPDAPVAAFWGSDVGEGSPGGGPDSPPGSDVWTITADGRIDALTHDATSRDPWLSTDGRRLYFVRSEYGTLASAAAPGEEIWLHDLGTGEQTLLVDRDFDDGREVTDVEESPDGSTLVFSSSEHRLPQIYLLDLEGGGEPVPLFPPAPRDDPLLRWHAEPTFSPHGDALAYLATEVDRSELAAEARTSVRLVDLASGEDSLVYEPSRPSSLRGLEWSPDGASVLVTEGFAETLSIDLSTGNRSVLAAPSTFTTTFSGDSTVSGIGGLYESDDLAEREKMITWRSGEVIMEDLPLRLSFAAGLTVAGCAYGPAQHLGWDWASGR